MGREAELEQLREALNGTLAGRGGLLLLVGEPGIGKTRTAGARGLRAGPRRQRAPGTLARGRGRAGVLAVGAAIRSYVREADPVALAWELRPGAGDVAHLVPEVRERLGDVAEAPALDSDEARSGSSTRSPPSSWALRGRGRSW